MMDHCRCMHANGNNRKLQTYHRKEQKISTPSSSVTRHAIVVPHINLRSPNHWSWMQKKKIYIYIYIYIFPETVLPNPNSKTMKHRGKYELCLHFTATICATIIWKSVTNQNASLRWSIIWVKLKYDAK